jgi:hypothetical protein
VHVPNIIQNVTRQKGAEAGQLVGLQLLIPRILGSAAAHMAHSGYWGYFIGLSALKPRKRWPILGVGYFSEAALHALWNASGAEGRTFAGLGGSFVLCVFGSGDFESQSSVSESSAKFCHDNIFWKVTADCLIVEVPGHLKLPFFSCVLTRLNLPMLKLYPLQ